MKTLHEIWPELLIQTERAFDSDSDTNNLICYYPKNTNPLFEDFINSYHDQIMFKSYNKSLQFKLSSIIHNITDKAFVFQITSTMSTQSVIISVLTVLANEYIDSLNRLKS